jgi:FkbM family methyltransferase
MTARAALIVSDFVGLARICGPLTAFRWLAAVVQNIKVILHDRNLQSADITVGRGPFLIRHLPARKSFLVAGDRVLTGVREMYVRDGYLQGGTLNIEDGDIVVDLGANIGLFTAMALAHGPRVRVLAMEPSMKLNAEFDLLMQLNVGFPRRVNLIRGFVGLMNKIQERAIRDDSYYRTAPIISENDLIQVGELKRIDFLKCDIEGGEFAFLNEKSKLLAMTRKLAIEIHAFAGDVHEFIGNLKCRGFSILHIRRAPDGSCVLLAVRQ